MNRRQLAELAEQVGREVNNLREELLAANYPYTAGIVRTAEEGILVAHTALSDLNVPERDL